MSISNLLQQFNSGQYRKILDQALDQKFDLLHDPLAAQVVAGAHFQLGEFSKAESILDQHQASLGDDVNYLSLFGATCRRLGQLSKARQFFKKAIQIDPLSTAPRNNYANLLIDLGEFLEAKDLLQSLLADNPNYSDAQENLTRLELKIAQQSLDHDDQGSGLGTWIPADPLLLAFAEEEVAQAGAINFTKPATQSAAELATKLPNPDLVAIAGDQLKLAARSVQENNLEFALQLVTQSLQAIGPHSAIYVNAGDVYVRLQRFNEAEICFLHALQLGCKSLEVYLNLATLANVRGDTLLSKHYLDSAAAIEPNDPNLLQIRNQVSTDSVYIFKSAWVANELTPQ